MKPEIIWRNPALPPITKRRIEQIVADKYGAVYAVRGEDETTVFELILGRAA
jgi:hypothetical protein